MLLPIDGGSLVVTVRRHDGPKAIIYFGGNGDDVSGNLDALTRAFPEHALYLMHYRGYGGSSGTPSEEANAQDAAALFEQVHAEHPNVSVIGRSLGSGVAVRLASQHPVAHLVLVTPYDSILNVAAQKYRWFPVWLLLRDRYESIRYAPLVTAPTLIVAAQRDAVISSAHSTNLLAHFNKGIATMITLAGVGHNDFESNPEYWPALEAAIR